MNEELIVNIFIAAWVGNLVIPIILFILDLWLSFTFRQDMKEWATSYQAFKYNKAARKMGLISHWEKYDRGYAALCWAMFDLMIVAGLLFVLGAFTVHVGTIGFIIIGIIVGAIFIPRIFVDITRALRYNSKTGDADRLNELQREIDKLKAKSDGQS